MSACQRYECFNCNKDFDVIENGMCPYCHSTNIFDRADKLGHYQIFWDDKGTNTFEFRTEAEILKLKDEGKIAYFTLLDSIKKE